MKKGMFSLLVILLVAGLVLAACSSSKTGSNTTGSSASTGGSQSLPLAGQLLVGTLKLEGTDNAVTAKQAADLLPLWQAYAQLINSDSAAQAEIDAVLAQIQSTMTDSQVAAINAMKLAQKDMLSQMGALGFDPNATPASGTAVAPSANGFGGGFQAGAGGPPSGDVPPSGGMPSGGAAPSGGFVTGGDGSGGFGGAGGQTSSTQVAGVQTRSNALPSMLINALIDLLQKRAAS